MSKAQSAYTSLLYRVHDLLLRKPKSYDVVFSVGPTKKEVKAVRILLEAASPVLEKQFEFWDTAEASKRSGAEIPLPQFDPAAFEVFVKLTMLDEWTVPILKNLKLPPGQVMNLASICRVYEMESALKNVEELMKSFYGAFATFKNTEDFLRLSHSNLLTILSSDNLPINEIDVYDCACRWGKAECTRRKLKQNPENLQLVLGDCFFEIRFPLMTQEEYTLCLNKHRLLTPEEGDGIFELISNMESREGPDADDSLLPFKTWTRGKTVDSEIEPGMIQQFTILRLVMSSPIVDDPPFVCDGEENYIDVETNHSILVHGLGFLGPIYGDAIFDVTVRFENYKGRGKNKTFASKPIQKRIFARKGKVFRIMFEKPITFDEGSTKRWTNYYGIYHSLKGAHTKSFQRKFGTYGTCRKRDGENEFRFWWESNQLAEILYSNV